MFKFGAHISAFADSRMLSNQTSAKLWHSCSFNCGNISFEKGDDLTFTIGDVQIPTLESGSEDAIKVTENGAAVAGRDYNGLLRGFSALCLKIEYISLNTPVKEFYLPVCEQHGKYKLSERMIHLCVFPETTFSSILKYVQSFFRAFVFAFAIS